MANPDIYRKMFEHHRKVDSAQHHGMAGRLIHCGTKDYVLGSHPLWEFLRCLYQTKNPPYIVGGALVLAGYFWAMITGVKRIIPQDLMQMRRDGQMQRLKQGLQRVF